MNTKPPPGSKGQGKGIAPKGQGKGVKSSPGDGKNPNLKPSEERAEPTTEEAKCPKCPSTYNWTTRVVCCSCGCKLPRGNVPKAPSPQKSAGPASVKTGGDGSSSGASSGTSNASVVKGEAGPAKTVKEEKGTQQNKAESLEKLLATSAKDDPLREDLENQLEQLRAALKDPHNPGARLDSAKAKMRKAEAKVQKCEEQLRQAEASLKSAHAEKEEASSELKTAQENAVPNSQNPPWGMPLCNCPPTILTDLTDMLKQCGLLAVAAVEDASEAQAKKARTGPYDNPPQNSQGDCKVGKSSVGGPVGKQCAHFGGSGEEWWGWVIGGDTPWGCRSPPTAPPPPPTQPCGTRAASAPCDGPVNPRETVKDTETQSLPDAQMRDWAFPGNRRTHPAPYITDAQ